MGVGYIIGPRIAGYLFAGGFLAYMVLIPAIKLFGSGLTQPIFAEPKLIGEMSPGEVRAYFVFYIGAGAVATAGIIALVRSLPTIVAAFRSGFEDLRGSVGEAASRLSDGFQDQHPEVPWRAIRGMRNLVAHDYGRIDHRIVWNTLKTDFPELADRLRRTSV